MDSGCDFLIPGFPLRLETWKNLEASSNQGNRLEKSGKIIQNTGKVREFQTNVAY